MSGVRTPKKNSQDTAIEMIELRPQEVLLLKVLRNSLRFGEVTIKMRDGVPSRIVRIQEFVALDSA